MNNKIHINKTLNTIVVAETKISCLYSDPPEISIRGYNLVELSKSMSFEEVILLLLYGVKTDKSEVSKFKQDIAYNQAIPEEIKNTIKTIPYTADPLEVIRICICMLGVVEPEIMLEKQYDIAKRFSPFMISCLLFWHYSNLDEPLNEMTKKDTLVEHFLTLLGNKYADNDLVAKTLNQLWILYIEHELASSTFAARVCASSGSDMYSSVVAALSTLSGPFHGGASESALTLVLRTPNTASAQQIAYEMIENHIPIMGFGHPIYKKPDPRAPIVKKLTEKLINNQEKERIFSVAETYEKILKKEKGVYPNIDFYTGILYNFLDVPKNFLTSMFAIARVNGWCAHIIEQRSNNKMIRPKAEYTGNKVS